MNALKHIFDSQQFFFSSLLHTKEGTSRIIRRSKRLLQRASLKKREKVRVCVCVNVWKKELHRHEKCRQFENGFLWKAHSLQIESNAMDFICTVIGKQVDSKCVSTFLRCCCCCFVFCTAHIGSNSATVNQRSIYLFFLLGSMPNFSRSIWIYMAFSSGCLFSLILLSLTKYHENFRFRINIAKRVACTWEPNRLELTESVCE